MKEHMLLEEQTTDEAIGRLKWLQKNRGTPCTRWSDEIVLYAEIVTVPRLMKELWGEAFLQ